MSTPAVNREDRAKPVRYVKYNGPQWPRYTVIDDAEAAELILTGTWFAEYIDCTDTVCPCGGKPGVTLYPRDDVDCY